MEKPLCFHQIINEFPSDWFAVNGFTTSFVPCMPNAFPQTSKVRLVVNFTDVIYLCRNTFMTVDKYSLKFGLFGLI